MSMSPTMTPGTLYSYDSNFPIEQLQEGDIIVFENPSGTKVQLSNGTIATQQISHRIVDIDYKDGSIDSITTKGDNNPISGEGIDLTDSIDSEDLDNLYLGKVLLDSKPGVVI